MFSNESPNEAFILDAVSQPNRRSFFRLIPAACASAVGQTPVAPVKKESLHDAEKLMGLPLSDAQEAMILPAIERNLENYESLRSIPVALDIDPPATFHPVLPGMRVPSPARKPFAP